MSKRTGSLTSCQVSIFQSMCLHHLLNCPVCFAPGCDVVSACVAYPYTHISICHPLWIYALSVSLPLLMYALSVYHPLMIQPNIHHCVYVCVGGVEVGVGVAVGETVSFVLMLAMCTCCT